MLALDQHIVSWHCGIGGDGDLNRGFKEII